MCCRLNSKIKLEDIQIDDLLQNLPFTEDMQLIKANIIKKINSRIKLFDLSI